MKFVAPIGGTKRKHYHWHVLYRRVQHVYINPATPRLNGKVERSHRIDADECCRLLDGGVLDDAQLFTTKLQEWEDLYNFDRPHGGLCGQTPYERLRQETEARMSPAIVTCTPRCSKGSRSLVELIENNSS